VCVCVRVCARSADVYTYKELADITSIPAADLKRNLLSLCCGKYHVLTKEIKVRMQDQRLYRLLLERIASKLTGCHHVVDQEDRGR
jgi:hypothetical protein